MFLDEPSKHDLTVETAGVAGLERLSSLIEQDASPISSSVSRIGWFGSILIFFDF